MEAAASATAASKSTTGPRLKTGTTCRASDRPVTDSLGTGRTLAVECTKPGQPTLLLEITLYDGKSFLALRAGMVNTTKQSLRVKEFYPLTAARAFPEAGEIRHAKTLNAEGGGRDTIGAVRPRPLQFQQRADDLPKRRSAAFGGARRADLSRMDEVGRRLAVGLRALRQCRSFSRVELPDCASRRKTRRLPRLRRGTEGVGRFRSASARASRQALRFRQRLCRPLLQHRAVRRQAGRDCGRRTGSEKALRARFFVVGLFERRAGRVGLARVGRRLVENASRWKRPRCRPTPWCASSCRSRRRSTFPLLSMPRAR